MASPIAVPTSTPRHPYAVPEGAAAAPMMMAPPGLPMVPVLPPLEPKNTAGAPRKGGVATANSFKKPEEIVASIEVIAEYKAKLRPDKTLVLAFLSGIYVGLGVLVAATMGFGSPAIAAADPGLAKFIYACMFPTALMFVLILGGELVTSNMSTMTLGFLAQRVSAYKALRNVFLAYFGNLAGSLFLAAVLIQTTGLMDGSPWNAALIAAATNKIHLTWTQAFVRGIGCNFVVNCAVWMSQAAEDITGKILTMWFPIALFATVGFEHSVANMTFIPAAMMIGAPITVGEFIVDNLIPVTIGNIVGALLLTVPYFYVYWLPNHPIDFHKCDFGLSHCFSRPEGEDHQQQSWHFATFPHFYHAQAQAQAPAHAQAGLVELPSVSKFSSPSAATPASSTSASSVSSAVSIAGKSSAVNGGLCFAAPVVANRAQAALEAPSTPPPLATGIGSVNLTGVAVAMEKD